MNFVLLYAIGFFIVSVSVLAIAAMAQTSLSVTVDVAPVCLPGNPMQPYYVIPDLTMTQVSLPIIMPTDDVLTVTSSLPSSLLATPQTNIDSGVTLITLLPLAGPHTNPCPPSSPDETVSVTDSEGLLSMVMTVDISGP